MGHAIARFAVGEYRDAEGGITLVALHSHDWQLRAACRGPQAAVFFPPPRHERKHEKIERELMAKSICGQCCVRSECLDYAIEIREQHGIWGGHSEVERKRFLQVVQA
ncbi:MAG: WhiB family transcriptional regulator [Actinomycetia bacterium]|nr:WhiB family transcriptional regulator [Actinomycetes bacterium]MCP4961584.1 WhiB family transcriptional regulator [Actinomycetes bacterium]